MKHFFLLSLIILTTIFFWFTSSKVSACGACEVLTGTFSVRNCALVSVPDYSCNSWADHYWSATCWGRDCWGGGCEWWDGTPQCWSGGCGDWYTYDCGGSVQVCNGWVITGYHNELSCWNEVVENCRYTCGNNQTCENGACRDNGPPVACRGGCGNGQTCIIDPEGFGECQETQASSCESCAGGGTLYCTPNCSAGAQCWCTGNPSPACSGGNTSGCGSVDCPGSLGGYWTCNQGRCEAVCQQTGGPGGCTPGAATCTTCAGGRQQCDNGCSTYQQDCVSCVSTKPQKPIAISPSGETTAKNVALKYQSFSNLAEWGAFCPINTNSYTYYMDEESSPTLLTQVGGPYVSNPPYQNNYCGGTYPCDIVSPMFPVLYSRNYKWKVTACNGAGSCTDSDIMHFTVRDSPGWWQTVGGGDVYGVDVQSEIGENASPALIILN